MLRSMTGAAFALPSPRGPVAARRASSVRRTSSIDVTWPAGRLGVRVLHGRARDIFSRSGSDEPQVLALHEMQVEVGADRVLRNLATHPPVDALQSLVGLDHARILRKAAESALSAQAQRSTPLHLLLDDLPGTQVIADWAWSRWPHLQAADEQLRRRVRLESMQGVCTGFRPGSSALRTDGSYQQDQAAVVPSLVRADDPLGWHAMVEPREVSMRRARCIDVWIEGDIRIEATFQDSASTPDGRRVAVHEYGLYAEIDLASGALRLISATPHVLPFAECPEAVGNIHLLVGTPAHRLRDAVLQLLRRTLGCTHLNDALRSLADVPALVGQLHARRTGEPPGPALSQR
jgi:hypothetical protein